MLPGLLHWLWPCLSGETADMRTRRHGIQVDHVTIYRWVLKVTPLLTDAARPWRHLVGDRRQADETYV